MAPTSVSSFLAGTATRLEGKQGETFRFENVTVRTDEDGLREAVLNDAAAVVETESGQQAGLDNDGTQAATDGGEKEITGAKGKVAEYIRSSCKKGDTVTAGAIAGDREIDVTPDEATSALETIASDMRLLTETSEGYEVL